jgi:hypothetical protein
MPLLSFRLRERAARGSSAPASSAAWPDRSASRAGRGLAIQHSADAGACRELGQSASLRARWRLPLPRPAPVT